jgi:creatinine amidohydrolase
MTEYYAYADLTWPEVARLPHDQPLIIPLGDGYSLDRLAGALGNPAQIGLLPTIPYGWTSSSLPVAGPLLAAMIKNLLDSLREDGFTQVYALTPPGLSLGLGGEQIRLPTGRIYHVEPPEDDLHKVILIPIGHTEQHAFHLPLSTDTLIIDAVCQGTAAQIPERAVSLPVMPYGVSTHRSAFAGTLNCGGRAFEDFWLGVIDTLVLQGYRMVYLLSGHGGNCSFLSNIVKYAGERHLSMFSVTAWLYLSGPVGIAALEKYRRSGRGGMGHACELETSLLLHLKPGLVHMERVVDEVDFITTPSYYMDWVEGGALVANPPWEDDSTTGAYGAGSLATAENGRIWLEAAIEEKAAHVDEIIEQVQRRSQRRQERRTG